MKAREIIDSLISDVSGGTRSTSDVLTAKYVAKNMDSVRAEAINRRWLKYSTINPQCYQRFYLAYDSNLQIQPNPTLGCYPYVLFKLPPVIQLGEGDGIRYLGALNSINNWRRIRSLEELSTVMAHPITTLSNNPGFIYYRYDGNRCLLEVYNDKNVQEGLAECIFQVPSENPFYNVDEDSYPVDAELIDLMRSILYERLAITKAADPKSLPYEQPDTKPSLPPRNLKISPQNFSNE